MLGKDIEREQSLALGLVLMRSRDQTTEVGVTGLVLSQENHVVAAFECYFAADDWPEASIHARFGEANRSIERIAIGQGERAKSKLCRARDEILDRGRATQQGEVTVHVQRRVMSNE